MDRVQEKKKIKLIKFFATLFFIATVAFSIYMTIGFSVDIKDHRCVTEQITGDVFECTVTILFDKPVSGEFEIVLYDDDGKVIFTKDEEVTEKNTKHIFKYNVSDFVEKYKIDEYYFTTSSLPNMDMIAYALLVVASLVFALAFRLNCSSFYFNNTRIIVYAGLSSCYLKANNIIYDKQKRAGKLGTNLFATLDNGDRVQAVVDRKNKIHLTVNELYCEPEKKQNKY